MSKKDFKLDGEKIHILSDEELTEKIMAYGRPRWRAKLIGGYCTPTSMDIYIRESRKHDIKLLNHERGHLKGYKHKIYFGLMASCSLWRWFNYY